MNEIQKRLIVNRGRYALWNETAGVVTSFSNDLSALSNHPFKSDEWYIIDIKDGVAFNYDETMNGLSRRMIDALENIRI